MSLKKGLLQWRRRSRLFCGVRWQSAAATPLSQATNHATPLPEALSRKTKAASLPPHSKGRHRRGGNGMASLRSP